MLKRLVFVALIVSVVFAASMASAYLVQLNYVKVDPAKVVTIGGTYYSGGVYAGNYVVDIAGMGRLYGYCVDPSNAPGSTKTYDLRPIPESTEGSGSGYEAAAWVLAQRYTGNHATAAQIAVWELVWDWESENLANGNFTYSGSSYTAEVQNIINAALAVNYSTFDHSGYRLAVSPPTDTFFRVNYQDYIVPIPIPAAAWLLGSGLIGLVIIRRRRKK